MVHSEFCVRVNRLMMIFNHYFAIMTLLHFLFELEIILLMDKQLFDDLASKISAALPPMPGNVSKELEHSLRGILHNTFNKLELVTREDFEIQAAVLQKTRLKLELLEKKLAELEQQLNIK